MTLPKSALASAWINVTPSEDGALRAKLMVWNRACDDPDPDARSAMITSVRLSPGLGTMAEGADAPRVTLAAMSDGDGTPLLHDAFRGFGMSNGYTEMDMRVKTRTESGEPGGEARQGFHRYGGFVDERAYLRPEVRGRFMRSRMLPGTGHVLGSVPFIFSYICGPVTFDYHLANWPQGSSFAVHIVALLFGDGRDPTTNLYPAEQRRATILLGQ